jgi:predicted HD phosphohydrolase
MEKARTVAFTAMKDGTAEDYHLLRELEEPFVRATPDRILRTMAEQENETLEGYKVSRLTHGLQCASRAWRDGADIDWVVGALLHDIGDGLAPQNHDEFAAAILRPYLREEVVWCVQHHAAF